MGKNFRTLLISLIFGVLKASIGNEVKHDHGTTAKIGDVPFVVMLTSMEREFVCAGSLITATHSITAANCFRKRKEDKLGYCVAGDVHVIAGVSKPKSRQERAVIAYAVHPKYKRKNQSPDPTYDVAVITVASPFFLTSAVKAIDLCSEELKDESEVFNLGFESFVLEDSTALALDKKLHYDVFYMDRKICQAGKLFPGIYCTFHNETACILADLGAPLVTDVKTPVLYGLMSLIEFPPHHPWIVLYANIYLCRPWILADIRKQHSGSYLRLKPHRICIILLWPLVLTQNSIYIYV